MVDKVEQVVAPELDPVVPAAVLGTVDMAAQTVQEAPIQHVHLDRVGRAVAAGLD